MTKKSWIGGTKAERRYNINVDAAGASSLPVEVNKVVFNEEERKRSLDYQKRRVVACMMGIWACDQDIRYGGRAGSSGSKPAMDRSLILLRDTPLYDENEVGGETTGKVSFGRGNTANIVTPEPRYRISPAYPPSPLDPITRGWMLKRYRTISTGRDGFLRGTTRGRTRKEKAARFDVLRGSCHGEGHKRREEHGSTERHYTYEPLHRPSENPKLQGERRIQSESLNLAAKEKITKE